MGLNKITNFKDRFIQLLSCDHGVLSLLLGILGLTAAIGFAFIKSSGVHYSYVPQVAPMWVWGLIFGSYATVKLAQVFFIIHKYAMFIASIVGMWLWNFLLLDSVVLDKSGVTPMELLLVVPVFCEVWALAIILYTATNTIRRRRG